MENTKLTYNIASSSLKDCVESTIFTDDAIDESNPAALKSDTLDFQYGLAVRSVQITNSGIPLILTRVDTDNKISELLGFSPLIVNTIGHTYYADPSDFDSYNTSSLGVVSSFCKPDGTTNILLKSRQTINTKELWTYYTDLNTDKETDYTYSLKNKAWEYQRLN